MIKKAINLLAATAMVPLLVNCGATDESAYSGKVYEPTQRIATAFQYTQVPNPCRVFAESLVELPAGLSGQEIQQVVFREAGERGADMVLIGQTRQREDDEELRFVYYGPDEEYNCAEDWSGWKYGYDQWEEQGEWVNIGLKEWGNSALVFEEPLMMQVAMLRCR